MYKGRNQKGPVVIASPEPITQGPTITGRCMACGHVGPDVEWITVDGEWIVICVRSCAIRYRHGLTPAAFAASLALAS